MKWLKTCYRKVFVSVLALSMLGSASFVWADKGTASPPRMSETLSITGQVAAPLTLSVTELAQMTGVTRTEVPLVCLSGEEKGKLQSAKGVSLKTLLIEAGIRVPKPKDFRKLAIIAYATDDYWVTYSWGEIFNRPDGESVVVFYEQNGVPLGADRGRFNLVPTQDTRTGGREVKWLERIEVRLLQP